MNGKELFLIELEVRGEWLTYFYPRHSFFVDGILYDYQTVNADFVVDWLVKFKPDDSAGEAWHYDLDVEVDTDHWMAEGSIVYITR